MAAMIDIKVVPSAGKQAFTQDKSGKIKCFLKSPPEKGKANKELIKVMSKQLSVPQDDIAIIKGATSRNKTLQVKSIDSKSELFSKLGLEQQLTL